jgi:hypothetical protein
MYGSPFSSGYGDLSMLFSRAHILPNLERYPYWLAAVHTPLIAIGVAAPWLAARGVPRTRAIWLLLFAGATLACYLPYVVYDAWWYTRFLLPAIPPLLALASAAALAIILRAPVAVRAPAALLLFSTLVIVNLHTAQQRDVFRIRDLEWRYRSAGEYMTRLPAGAAIITVHQSGSIRFYAGLPTLGWADVDKGRLDDAIEFVKRHGRKPFLVFEPWEEPLFKQRFAGERLAALDWPPIADVDRVRIYDPDDYERHRRGETVHTDVVVTRAGG